MIPDVTDEHLVKQAQEGDREAFLMLYNRYLKKVYNRVKSRVPPQDAEDVTQEIFLAVARSLHKFEQRSRFNTWLYTIVNRQIADYYRRFYRTNENRSVSLEEQEGLELVHAEEGNMDEQLVIQQALQALPENYQEVILMRFSDGLSFAEIAAQRGQSLEATKSLFRRAIQALNAKVEEGMP
jgi:RNA polymerase sigma-70 factor (ECF subfamily)